jgi:hypothetical protein
MRATQLQFHNPCTPQGAMVRDGLTEPAGEGGKRESAPPMTLQSYFLPVGNK